MCSSLNVWSHPFCLLFCFLESWKAVLPNYLPHFPLVFLLFFPNPLQITVSLAQGYEQTSSSPKPRFKSYAYTQAAYVATSDSTRSPFPSQVCQHLLSLYKPGKFFQDDITYLLLVWCLQYFFPLRDMFYFSCY